MAYAKVIINPSAGADKTRKKVPEIERMLREINLDFSSIITEGPGHAVKIAEESVKAGAKMIVSVGGDGTINEVANGIYNAGGLAETALGIVSTGTGADYIRTLGLPRSIDEAVKKLQSPKFNNVDLGKLSCMKNGKATERLFVNFAGLGFDAEIVRATSQKYKSLGKVAAYLMALLTILASYRNKNIKITINGVEETHKICTTIMGNGKYGGGGMMTTPEADISDGLLDVLVVGDLSKPDLLASLPRIYKGTHLTHPKVRLKKAAEISIKTEEVMTVQADGDLMGETPVTFSILPRALKIIL